MRQSRVFDDFTYYLVSDGIAKRRHKAPKPETERYIARLGPDTILFFADYADKYGLPMRDVFRRAAQALEDSSE